MAYQGRGRQRATAARVHGHRVRAASISSGARGAGNLQLPRGHGQKLPEPAVRRLQRAAGHGAQRAHVRLAADADGAGVAQPVAGRHGPDAVAHLVHDNRAARVARAHDEHVVVVEQVVVAHGAVPHVLLLVVVLRLRLDAPPRATTAAAAAAARARARARASASVARLRAKVRVVKR